MSNCSGTSSAAGSGTLSDTPVILDVRWRRGPDIAPWTHSWSSCIYSFKEISTDYLPYTGVHHSLETLFSILPLIMQSCYSSYQQSCRLLHFFLA